MYGLFLKQIQDFFLHNTTFAVMYTIIFFFLWVFESSLEHADSWESLVLLLVHITDALNVC